MNNNNINNNKDKNNNINVKRKRKKKNKLFKEYSNSQNGLKYIDKHIEYEIQPLAYINGLWSKPQTAWHSSDLEANAIIKSLQFIENNYGQINQTKIIITDCNRIINCIKRMINDKKLNKNSRLTRWLQQFRMHEICIIHDDVKIADVLSRNFDKSINKYLKEYDNDLNKVLKNVINGKIKLEEYDELFNKFYDNINNKIIKLIPKELYDENEYINIKEYKELLQEYTGTNNTTKEDVKILKELGLINHNNSNKIGYYEYDKNKKDEITNKISKMNDVDKTKSLKVLNNLYVIYKVKQLKHCYTIDENNNNVNKKEYIELNEMNNIKNNIKEIHDELEYLAKESSEVNTDTSSEFVFDNKERKQYERLSKEVGEKRRFSKRLKEKRMKEIEIENKNIRDENILNTNKIIKEKQENKNALNEIINIKHKNIMKYEEYISDEDKEQECVFRMSNNKLIIKKVKPNINWKYILNLTKDDSNRIVILNDQIMYNIAVWFHLEFNHINVKSLKNELNIRFNYQKSLHNLCKTVRYYCTNCNIMNATQKINKSYKYQLYNEKTISMDTKFVTQNIYVLVIMNVRTGYIYLELMKNVTGLNVIMILDKYISIFGFVKNILTDNGSEFINLLVNDYAKRNNIKLITGISYNKTLTSKVERKNKEINRMIKSLDINFNNVKKLKFIINRFMVKENNKLNSNSQISPNELIFGRNNNIEIDLNVKLDEKINDEIYLGNLKYLLKYYKQINLNNLIKYKKMKDKYYEKNKKIINYEFKIGEYILLNKKAYGQLRSKYVQDFEEGYMIVFYSKQNKRIILYNNETNKSLETTINFIVPYNYHEYINENIKYDNNGILDDTILDDIIKNSENIYIDNIKNKYEKYINRNGKRIDLKDEKESELQDLDQIKEEFILSDMDDYKIVQQKGELGKLKLKNIILNDYNIKSTDTEDVTKKESSDESNIEPEQDYKNI